ncbi:hypothetical protein BG74_05520 [Sodalis-like endosymbiont of Proechinophthirus fluctus]|uniref:hypothetical protein n=1 Tax=Sodalis-like endosymbiont of Proechinophthirus fluctus TaxID=1462730 RepID=UPI0007A7E2EB|nr:hypothetical protein [Sodalis-like endosymbiont of Proechinophthirus fluctus]KYP97094.1 hypothetical protein BG74_05520 [Sodalis-like endosymbiont of Proechinophthirus fluctus]
MSEIVQSSGAELVKLPVEPGDGGVLTAFAEKSVKQSIDKPIWLASSSVQVWIMRVMRPLLRIILRGGLEMISISCCLRRKRVII